MADAQDTVDKLRNQAGDRLDKLSYFVTGLAASALAFTFHETTDWQLAWSLAWIGAAGVAYSISVALGVLHAEAMLRLSNIDTETARVLHSNASMERIASLQNSFQRWSRKANRRFFGQWWGLLAGVALYAAGHTMHLFENAGYFHSLAPSAAQVSRQGLCPPAKTGSAPNRSLSRTPSR